MTEKPVLDFCDSCGFVPTPITSTRYKCPNCMKPWGIHNQYCDKQHTDNENCNEAITPPPPPPQQRDSTSAQEVVEYWNRQLFDAECLEWIESGWLIKSVTEQPQPAGCMRILTLGLWSLIVPPTPHVLVVYERQAPSAVANADAAPATVAGRPATISGELERLAALHERGALTDEEFEQAKRGVLGGT